MTGESEKARLSVIEKPREPVLKILLVDDDEEAALARRRALATATAHGHLEHASDARAAAALLGEGQWDVVALDPVGAADFDFLRHVKTSLPWIATIVFLQSRTPRFLGHAIRSLVDDVLFKPVTASQFVDRALRLAEEANARRKRQQRRVLAIGAHPDDVEIGCGGALARHRARGDILHILTLSRGAGGGDINVRSAEAQRAAHILGASLRFADMPDGRITDGLETIERIEDAVGDLTPTDVYTHSFEDTHQDHRAVHAASMVAARAVPNFYCYQSPSSTVDFRPNRFVDITYSIKLKLQAIGAYQSQVGRLQALHSDDVLASARYWGRFASHLLVEPLRIVRQLDDSMADAGSRTLGDLSASDHGVALCAAAPAAAAHPLPRPASCS
jgi:LmbE family N-acetylglucosaminyl deacetylase